MPHTRGTLPGMTKEPSRGKQIRQARAGYIPCDFPTCENGTALRFDQEAGKWAPGPCPLCGGKAQT
jgi:hypothetical protein